VSGITPAEWTDAETTLLEAFAAGLEQTLESAQLFHETQRRAAREQAIRQVTERMRAAVDIEAILQTTVAELTRALGVPRAYVRLGTEVGAQPSERPVHQTGLPTEPPGNGEGIPDLAGPDPFAPADTQSSGEEGDD
jgi:GAF domain-containing protein